MRTEKNLNVGIGNKISNDVYNCYGSTDEQKLNNLHKRLKKLIGYTDTNVYLDSDDILECCKNILAVDSDDRLAQFVELATKESNVVRNVISFLNDRLNETDFFCPANKEYIRVIIRYLSHAGEEPILKKLKIFLGKCEPIFSNEPDEIDGYKTGIEELISRLSGNEYYNSSIDRTAFIIYANEDIFEVEQLAKELEAKGLKCYYAARNLRNGRNAAANYEKEIKNAIAHCDCTVFVSSKNSRTNVNTIKERGWSNELKPGVPHFEYLIEGYPETKTVDDKLWQAYFNGNHWRTKGQFAELHADIVEGVAEYKSVRASKVKYCKACGEKLDIRAVRCPYCESDEFVATYEEYVDLKNKTESKNCWRRRRKNLRVNSVKLTCSRRKN